MYIYKYIHCENIYIYIHNYICTCSTRNIGMIFVYVAGYVAVHLYIITTKFFVVPSEPKALDTINIASTSVSLQWMPPEFPNGCITHYSIHYNGMDIDNFGSNANVSDKMIGTVDGLSPNTMYVFEMKAYTMMGAGPSVYLAVKTRKLINTYVRSCLGLVCIVYTIKSGYKAHMVIKHILTARHIHQTCL